jgi:K+/H+ antiporter YhaU regulatory subunit KhtT
MEPDSRLDLIIEDLPGIGRRYEMTGTNGGRIIVIITHSGRRVVHGLDPGADQASAVELTDRQARKLGAILGGAFFKPAVVEELEAVFGNLLEPATASSSSAATRTAARSTSWWSTEPYTLPGCGAG